MIYRAHVLFVVLLALCVRGALALAPEDASLIARNAERGNDAAQVLLAVAYLTGDGGLPKSPTLAAHWFELAALQGNSYAEERIADLYESGTGVPRSLRLAYDWRLKAARRGNLQAQVKLAQMYRNGLGVAANADEARRWLERAAVEGSIEAQLLLEKLDRENTATMQERTRAGTWLELAARQGYDFAMALLGLAESVGYEFEETWYHRLPDLRRLADDGDPEAQFQLAQRYERGSGGVEKDIANALLWYRHSADAGNRMAMLALDRLHVEGTGVPRDADVARDWTERAGMTRK